MGLYGRTLAGEGMGREEKIPKLIGSGSVDIRLLVTKIISRPRARRRRSSLEAWYQSVLFK